MVVLMASEKLLDLLNKGIAWELQASIQYMWQHVQVTGIEGAVVKDIFKQIAIAEMKHAEKIAERLSCLSGVPTDKPNPIFVGGSLIEMLKQDEQNEEEAIVLYKRTIRAANEEGDFATRHLLEEILGEEETHVDTFGKLLVGMTSPFTQPGF
jgi:bacterioferritin